MSPVTQVFNGTSGEAPRISVVRDAPVPLALARARAALRIGALAALVAAPFGFGAVTVNGSALLIAGAWLLLLLWVAASAVSGELRLPSHPSALPAVLLLGFAALHWAAGLSPMPYVGQLEWLRWTAYAALAVVAVDSFATPERLKLLCGTLAVAGLAIAALAIAQYLTANGKIYWLIEPQFGGWVFGPYVNHNHFAGLMELWLPLALGMALVTRRSGGLHWLWLMVALVMATAVVLSGSRGGVLAAGTGILAMTLAVAAIRGGRRAFLAFAVALMVLTGTALAVGGKDLLQRYSVFSAPAGSPEADVTGHRLAAYADTLRLFRQNWILGSGLETFGTLFPAVRSFPTDKIWSHAHNDYLQLLAELGIVGGALALWALLAGAARAWRNIRLNRDAETGTLLLAMACGCLGFLIHGMLDFNFHVPANAANFAVLAAVLGCRGWDEI